MAVVKKKAWPELFEFVLNGSKTFELRLADFDIKEGDTLILEEWDPKTKEYTGRKIEKKVGFTMKFSKGDLEKYWSAEEIDKHGLFAISLK